MKSKQLLSIVFSLIMFTGVSAGSAAFAESDEYYDDLEDQLEDFCYLTDEQRVDFFSDNPDMVEYDEKLAIICDIEDENDRYDELYDFIDAVIPEAKDVDDFDDEFDELEDESDDVIEDFEDCVEAGYPIMESFPEQCMTDDGTVFVNDKNNDDYELDDLLDRYCEKTDEQKRQLLADHPRLAQFSDRLANYCDLSEDEQDAIDDLIEEHGDMIRDEIKEYAHDYIDHKKDMRHMLDRYCDMTDEDKRAFVAEHEKTEDHVEKMNRYCSLDGEDAREDFIRDHVEEYKEHMKDKVHDKISDHMDYDRYCSMAASDRLSEITDVSKLDRISEWCDMTLEERDEYKREHHDEMKDKVKDKVHDKMMKFSDESKRLKAMIMEKHDISDERMDEIKMKFIEKHGDITDEKKSELKMKFKDHMLKVKDNLTDERKSEIHDRLAEMKAFKAELREKASDMTNEQKQQLREEFIEKAKDMHLAWISPRIQMTAGVDAAEVECREGFSLVMKASNGVAMCLKADTALKMIDRGIVVPSI